MIINIHAEHFNINIKPILLVIKLIELIKIRYLISLIYIYILQQSSNYQLKLLTKLIFYPIHIFYVRPMLSMQLNMYTYLYQQSFNKLNLSLLHKSLNLEL